MKIKHLLIMIGLSWALTSCTAANKNISSADSYSWFPFSWYAAKISGKNFDKVAMLVPVKVNDLNADFTLQFDLGSDATLIYGNTIDSYYKESDIKNFIIESSKSTDNGGKNVYKTKGLIYHLGKLSKDNLVYKADYGDKIVKDSLFTKKPKHIGTLGADMFNNKILIIDYPNKRMCVLDSLDSHWKKVATFVDAKSNNGRLHIPLTIAGKTHWFLFDTGASLFPINTNKELWTSLVDQTAKTDTIIANSWGEKVKFYGRPIKEKVYLGKRKLENDYAWYNDNKRLQEFNKAEQVDGLTGNAFFVNNIVVLDFKNKKFGVVN
ncbi:retropepsin-like domain-containing protein [Chryseobacterium herbae]|uniref:Retropepsin-like domain-containing protein n=1 Tax=Chryseobacterium herbae TaxID=2976476 RepID=A0ABT2IP74_9FLAO|nr:retropepsin-like domain-containing protein [Chryseobacterium sp. pc1-10]MCT2560618.1 retropepsin-like domain-containing protein [Chryseobacterium sp. pc1-10]